MLNGRQKGVPKLASHYTKQSRWMHLYGLALMLGRCAGWLNKEVVHA